MISHMLSISEILKYCVSHKTGWLEDEFKSLTFDFLTKYAGKVM